MAAKRKEPCVVMAGSHVALGVAAWLVASPHLGFGAAEPAGMAVAAACSLLPDIDHPKSWVGRRLGPLSTALSGVLGHRGVTHSALAVAACAWVLLRGGAPRWVADAGAVGYASHLLADILTPNGLRLAWPWRRTWALPLCKSGSPAEPLVVAVLVWWAVSGAVAPPPVQQTWRLLVGALPGVAHGAAHHATAGAGGRFSVSPKRAWAPPLHPVGAGGPKPLDS